MNEKPFTIKMFKEATSPNAIGKRIYEIRKLLNMSQQEFGKSIISKKSPNGVSKNAVNNWEKGRNKPSGESLESISKISNTSVDYILAGTYKDVIKEYNLYVVNEIKKISERENSLITASLSDIKSFGISQRQFLLQVVNLFKNFPETKQNSETWNDLVVIMVMLNEIVSANSSKDQAYYSKELNEIIKDFTNSIKKN
ncbi:helix-turn-helix domain-containing protein [Pediococcus ethanolidurans]|uniref:helix-turn-helix domain-containing protein n=1 Tax=Pediococcus ethanolidurans TaxID=319653 RepID=UPI0021E71C73|nr:helix-turn-helix transcriptional regulator [Pediococcus ethanolidurans]MCV3321548.1 helix-turn-helix domain-containing protein [Pediococcus ethanolidurans]